jgi:hypothetical protein
MQSPKLFDQWVSQAYIPDGTRFPGLFVYNSFIRYCDGRFKKLPRKVFYGWFRSQFGGNIEEGKDGKGLWFLVGAKHDIPENKISEFEFRENTCAEFVRWFNDTHPSIMYERMHANSLRDDFFSIYAPNGYVYIAGKGMFITKQRFNSWMRIGCKYVKSIKGMVEGRDTQGKWLILI